MRPSTVYKTSPAREDLNIHRHFQTMKLVLCLVAVAVGIGCVLGEPCHRPEDCSHEQCPENDWNVGCVMDTCTCVHGPTADMRCTAASDCHSPPDMPPCPELHCIDGRCHCLQQPGGPGGPVGPGGR